VVIPLLLKREARDLLRISRPTLDRLIGRGELPVVRLSGRSIRISEADLAGFLAQRTERRGPTGGQRADEAARAMAGMPGGA
jgi:excisionase family DNA binding protein